jgi:hypothetical protein
MNSKKARKEAIVITLLVVGAMLLVPVSSEETTNEPNLSDTDKVEPGYSEEFEDLGPFYLDRNYIIEDPNPASLERDDFDDAGTRRDAGDEIGRSANLFPGEIIDNTPGRGRTGKLSSDDEEDWYFFSVCEGQDIEITMTPPEGYDFNIGLWDEDEIERATSTNSGDDPEYILYTADYTGKWYLRILYLSGPDEGQYSFDVVLLGQNDANSGDDAANSFADAYLISTGTYYGYLDMNDPYDWYKFDVDEGDGIHFELNMKKTTYLSDFDITLYNPLGELVHEEDYYYDDELLYSANDDGEWRVKIDIFPGWVDIPEPTEWEYYTYGSGAYELIYSIESSAPPLPGPIPQPEITPIAQTFIIQNDFESTKDEYGYIASIPACNYLESGDRYLAPIVYEGDDTSTNYYGTEEDRGVVDDTTQYLVDDWNTYLGSYAKSAIEYNVPEDPVAAAAEIATTYWDSSEKAVVAVDGSDYEDEVKTVLSRSRTLRRVSEVETVPNDSEKIIEIGGAYGYPMFIGSKWGAVTVAMTGTGGAEPALNTVFPHYIGKATDWWPHPYDSDGPKTDMYFPVTRMGIWTAGADSINGNWEFEITKYACHRYRMWVKDPDSVINVKVETDEPSDLLVFLADPQGHLRAPDIPQWNGPVNPIHMWNGCEFDPDAGGYEPWREWDPEPHTEFSAEVLHPEKGLWTVIVVPRHAEGDDISYKLTGELTTVNTKRADAAVSAANAAVIASQEHAPLLYVKEDSVPSVTEDAFDALGVNEVIFVERNELGTNVQEQLPGLSDENDLTTMQQIIDYIKDYDHSENYISITSIKSGDGYIAPGAMLAAYHCSPVLRIGEASGNPAGVANRIETWRLWDGDFYHGSRSTGHLPVAKEPVETSQLKLLINMIKFFLSGTGELPPFGLDAKRYWNEELHDGIYNWINSYGLDLEGQEGYVFVAPRKDIYLTAHSVMMGNNSYAGHMVGETPAYTSAMVVRNILYPALIFANQNRDITTTQMMNFPDGGSWKTNDGNSQQVYSSREVKKSFGSHLRTFEGHCLWDAHLERMNEGASILYYSGHGTGGSGVSAQYYQTEFCNYPNQIWWDAWRGYTYDSWKTARYNGRVWYNAHPPMLYDIIHFDYVDGLFENLRSNAVFYMSCTTADADGPMVYLDHGAVVYYGNAGSGLCPEADLQDDEFFKDALIYGEPIGPAYSKQVWLHFRDFTTGDEASMYGSSSMQVTTVQCIYGDPDLIIYSPEWTSPVPVDA